MLMWASKDITILYIFLQLVKCSTILKNISLWCDNEDIIITYHCTVTNHLTLQQTLLEDLLQYNNYKRKKIF